jgi:hypothetical protein
LLYQIDERGNRRKKWFVPIEFRLFIETENSQNFQIISKIKMLGIPYRGTKAEANSQNSADSKGKMRQPKIPKVVSEKTTFKVQDKSFCEVILAVF